MWSLFGIKVESDLPLPAPPVAGGRPDVTIHWLGEAPPLAEVPSGFEQTWERGPRGWTLRYANAAGEYLEFQISPDGADVAMRHRSPFDRAEFLAILLGPAMGAVLRLRNTPALHGSSVVVDGGAVLLLSNSGAGKSTLAAVLVGSGRPLLCEEVAALSFDGEGVSILPGHSLLKLSPGAVKILGKPPETLPLVSPGFNQREERWLDAGMLKGGHCGEPVPLKAVYLIAGRRKGIRKPRIERLSPAHGGIALSRHFYGKRWLSPPSEESMRICARIAGAASVMEVWMPEGIAHVGSAAETIAEDALVR